MKKLLYLFFIVILFNINIIETNSTYSLPEMAPVNEEYVISSKEEEVIPPLVRAGKEDNLITKIDEYSTIIKDANAPTFFKLTNSNGGNLLSVKNQGSANLCWAFSATSVLESNLRLKNNIYTEYNPYHINGVLSYTYSNGNNIYGTKTNNTGGNFEHDMLYWASNLGPVSSYQNSTNLQSMQNTMVNASNVSIDELYLLDKVYNSTASTTTKAAFRNEVKSLLQNYGAVYIHAAAPQGSYFSSAYNSVYTTSVYQYNSNPHAMIIVGWNDNFSRYNFVKSNGSYPSIDGAWIVQNSWGSAYGDNGYYYYSYEDYMIGLFASGIKKTSEKLYDNTYQYNPTGSLTYINSKYAANIYNKINDKKEAITSVGIFSYAANTKVNVYINRNGSSLSGATKVNSSPISIRYAGYYTYYLPEYLEITGDEFAVIVEYVTYNVNSQTYKYSVPVHLSSHNSLSEEEVGILPNQSFISTNKSSWQDTFSYGYSVALKVHTTDLTTSSKSVESFIKNSKIKSGDSKIYINTYTSNVSNASAVTYKVKNTKGEDITSNFTIYDSKVVNNYATGYLKVKSPLKDGVYTLITTTSSVSNTKVFVVGDGYATNLLYNTTIVGTNYSRDINSYIETYENITWKSSNNNIVTVKDGVITGVSAGKANIIINNKYIIKVTVKDPITISSVSEFNNIRNDLDEYYILNNDIDFSNVTFTPIGTSSKPFTGIIDGNNKKIKNIKVKGNDYTGIIGYVKGGAISNIGFENVVVEASSSAGIIGYMTYGNVSNVYSYNSNVTGKNNVGSLVGYFNSSTMSDSFSISSVSADNNVGGLVGYSNLSNIYRSYNKGTISAKNNVGGIVGFTYYSNLKELYNEGRVTGTLSVGGIVGNMNTTNLNNSYNIANISGSNAGGIAGSLENNTSSNFYNTYNIGSITGTNIGGIIGYAVVSNTNMKLYNNYDIKDNTPIFGNINIDYTSSSELSQSNMKSSSYYNGFDFSNVWNMKTYPELKSIKHPTNIILSNTIYNVSVGEKITLDASIVSDSINKIAIYSLSNSNAKISKDYLVAMSKGSIVVTVSTTNGISKTFTVNITNDLNTDKYNFKDGYILGIKDNTTYKNFLNNINNNATIVLYDGDKVVNDMDSIIKTNMKINVNDRNYILIVLGDVNGDGIVKMNDVMAIAKYIVENKGITGNYLIAADVNYDNNIKMNDVMKISKYLVEGGTL